MDLFTTRLSILVLVFLVLAVLLFLGFSWFEKEKHAVKNSVQLLILALIVLSAAISGFLPVIVQQLLLFPLFLFFLLIFIPFGNHRTVFKDPEFRFDERDIMFSTMELKEGTQKFREYYSKNPDKKILDDGFRKQPGLLSPSALFYHSRYFEAAEDSFRAIQPLQALVDE